MKEGKGKITISLRRGGLHGDHMCITVVDDPSRVHFVEARVSIEGFMRALAGHGYIDCEFELRAPELVGMISEHKEEIVFVEDGDHHLNKERARAAIEPYEVDGWTGRTSDAENSHRWVRDKKPPEGKEGHWYRVTFHRHVAPEEPEDESHIQYWETKEARGQS